MWTDSEKRGSPAPHAQLLHQRSLQNKCGRAHAWVHTQLPSSGSDPSRPLGRWQLRQRHVRGREGRPGAAGRPALRGDPAGLGAELHVRRPFPPGLQHLSCLCSWPFPPRSDGGGQGAWGLQHLSASLEFTSSRPACPWLGSPRCLWKSVHVHRGSTRQPGGTPQGRDPPREGTLCAPSLLRALEASLQPRRMRMKMWPP